MQPESIQAFYVTTSAGRELGAACLDGAFDWQRSNPDLKRLTLPAGPLDMYRVAAWSHACFDGGVEGVLVLGPGDRTPDFDAYPMLLDVKVMRAHIANSPDMQALRAILHEPDEVFTAQWSDYASGSRVEFTAPGPVGAVGEVFWKSYGRALKAYSGPILGMAKAEFEVKAKQEWNCSLYRNDLAERGYANDGVVRFAVRRFPYCALVLDTGSKAWSCVGWLPEDLEQVDPGGAVRRECEESLSEARVLQVELAREAGELLAVRQAQEAETEWLEQATVWPTGVNRFVAMAMHDPLLTLEVAFQLLPGSGPSVVMTQLRGGEHYRAPLSLLGHKIDFERGVTLPSPEVAVSVASVMGLPDAYVHWAEVGSEFARTRRKTTGSSRSALREMLHFVTESALNPAHLYQFLFEPAGALRSNNGGSDGSTGGSSAAPVVSGVERTGPRSARIHLWWLDAAPEFERVDIFLAGKPIESLVSVQVSSRAESLDVAGVKLDSDNLPALAHLVGNVLRIDLG